jgi:hypothetical protein
MANRWYDDAPGAARCGGTFDGDDANFVEMERCAGRAGERQVAEVERIEGSPEDADASGLRHSYDARIQCEVF